MQADNPKTKARSASCFICKLLSKPLEPLTAETIQSASTNWPKLLGNAAFRIPILRMPPRSDSIFDWLDKQLPKKAIF
jgi:hypothetical protein